MLRPPDWCSRNKSQTIDATLIDEDKGTVPGVCGHRYVRCATSL